MSYSGLPLPRLASIVFHPWQPWPGHARALHRHRDALGGAQQDELLRLRAQPGVGAEAQRVLTRFEGPQEARGQEVVERTQEFTSKRASEMSRNDEKWEKTA